MDKPVRVAPHPAMLDCPLLSLVLSTGREAHAPFTVINSMSVSSGFERKNPLALIAAFRKAFGNASDCRLKMLISNAQHHAPARPAIEQALVGADNIEITWHGLDRQALWAWWRDADLYASLHRSEGFGLPLAEAMCAGTPVMATGWSGNMEFMSAKNSFLVDYKLIGVKDAQAKYVSGEEQWADPDIDHAAKILRQLKKSARPACGDGSDCQRAGANHPVLEPFLRRTNGYSTGLTGIAWQNYSFYENNFRRQLCNGAQLYMKNTPYKPSYNVLLVLYQPENQVVTT